MVDKLDKSPWEQGKVEMLEMKGLAEDVADQIDECANSKVRPLLYANTGAQELLEKLKLYGTLTEDDSASQGLQEP